MTIKVEEPPKEGGRTDIAVATDLERKLIMFMVQDEQKPVGFGVGLTIAETEWVIGLLTQAIADIKGTLS